MSLAPPKGTRSKIVRYLCCPAALVLLATCAAAAPPPEVTFNLTGVSGDYYGNVYTSPYYGDINGGTTIPVICDDFEDESFLPETWYAYDTNLSTLPASPSSDDTYLKWGSDANSSLGTELGLGSGFQLNQTQEYDVAAYLITELLNPSSGMNTNDLSFAIWGLFDSPAFSYVTGSDLTTAEAYLKAAVIAVGSPTSQAAYANVNIYSYVPTSGVWNCGGCAPPPQEFITVTTPEVSTPVLMAVDLLGFLALVGFLRKRMARSF
jgi:hypothetical protein